MLPFSKEVTWWTEAIEKFLGLKVAGGPKNMGGLKKNIGKTAKDQSVHIWLMQWSRLRKCPNRIRTESRPLTQGQKEHSAA